MGIIINADVCQGVADCVEVCPVEVIASQGGKCVVVQNDECIECEACISACPHGAIAME
ncbi:MAG: 4Fe-4S dicluster domain-containing protein [Chloroflexi bacterium]|nr:4Fe-4S dicluster domain-containing protein [Chloroflexota bacterium]